MIEDAQSPKKRKPQARGGEKRGELRNNCMKEKSLETT